MVSSYQGHLQESTRETYPRVGEFMSHSFEGIPSDMDIYQAMELILKNRVSGAPVVEGDKVLVGILSEKDCLKLATQDTYEAQPQGGPVSNYMTREVKSVTQDTSLDEVARIFLSNSYKKLPVVDGNQIVGVVRRHDVLMVIRDHYKKRMAFMRK